MALAFAGVAYEKNKSFAMLEYLERIGLKVDSVRSGENALTQYIELGKKNPKIIKYFLSKKAGFDIYNEHGETPLHLWAKFNEAKPLEIALEYGANPNIKTIKPDSNSSKYIGKTPLHEAVSRDTPALGSIRILLKYGAEVNAVKYSLVNPYIHTALDEVNHWHSDAARMALVKAGGLHWNSLVKKYKIDTSLETEEQVKFYEECLEAEKRVKLGMQVGSN